MGEEVQRRDVLMAVLRPRRVFVVALVALVVVVGYSYQRALRAPGTDSLGAKSVEWVREHGGSGIVRWIEKEWYGHHQPPARGTPSQDALPTFVSSSYTAAGALPPPADLTPVIPSPSVAGEGHWTPIGRPVRGAPAMYGTWIRPDAAHTKVVAAVVWMDTHLVRCELYSGYEVPGGGGWDPAAPVSSSAGDLVAAFNSGFRLQDAAQSGYYSRGRTAAPIIQGYGSLVLYQDGTATVGKWGRDVTATPDVVSIRQNLPLIIDNGRPVPELQDPGFQRWGATLGNKQYVWRSGVGVTADGALVYVAGADLSIYSLGDALIRAGAVRGMELDINTDWVDFFYFTPPSGQIAGPSNASKLLPGMVASKKRYFEKSSRDFVAVFAR